MERKVGRKKIKKKRFKLNKLIIYVYLNLFYFFFSIIYIMTNKFKNMKNFEEF